MAAYPTLPIMRASTTQREAGIEPVRASNGVLKLRRRYSADKMSFDLVHWLSDAQKATLEAFYQSDRMLNATLTWPEDGAAYTVRFAGAPLHVKQPGYWISTVRLLEV